MVSQTPLQDLQLPPPLLLQKVSDDRQSPRFLRVLKDADRSADCLATDGDCEVLPDVALHLSQTQHLQTGT
jgi:hypothetical protein